jgi:hypothetical protein
MRECCESKFSSKKILLVVFSFVVALISYDSLASGDHGSHSGPETMDHSKTNKSGRKILKDSTKKEVVGILEANEVLHNSFFNYNSKKVEEAANNLKVKIDSVSNPKISKLLTFSKNKLKEIKSSNSREDNNQIYHLVSMALIYIVNTYNVGKKYNAYSCPHVEKKWLQNTDKLTKIHNPYVKGMPHCGSKNTNH